MPTRSRTRIDTQIGELADGGEGIGPTIGVGADMQQRGPDTGPEDLSWRSVVPPLSCRVVEPLISMLRQCVKGYGNAATATKVITDTARFSCFQEANMRQTLHGRCSKKFASMLMLVQRPRLAPARKPAFPILNRANFPFGPLGYRSSWSVLRCLQDGGADADDILVASTAGVPAIAARVGAVKAKPEQSRRLGERPDGEMMAAHAGHDATRWRQRS